ncbi:MFS transporter [Paeniglutamicibacter sp.]|uniref:MFS transporter n=1 Tax=Paeniglutamicibacter sp. TaxID=1934391 RepID=UPI0039895E45
MSAQPVHRKPWFPAALSLMMVGWGANQFVSLLVFYRQEHGFSEVMVTSMLGIYVVGLVPALLWGGRHSDKTGRKPVTLFAIALSMAANVAMMGSVIGTLPLFAGRFMAGIATGLAMAAATSWVKELSQAPWDLDSVAGSGARRASLLTSAGFWLGPVVGGLLANYAPAPAILPYALHIVLCIPLLFVVARLPETRAGGTAPGSPVSGPAPHPEARKRFRLVVAPAALWVFAAGTTGFAVVPAVIPGLGAGRLAYATAAVAITLGCSVLIQPLARRLDTVRNARSLLTGTMAAFLGLAAVLGAILAASPALGLVASAILGSANGLLMVGGLLEIQRVAAAHELGKLTGFFYTLAYVGFLAPTVVAFTAQWVQTAWIMAGMLVLCLVSLAFIGANSRKYLPQALERVGSVPAPQGKEQKKP